MTDLVGAFPAEISRRPRPALLYTHRSPSTTPNQGLPAATSVEMGRLADPFNPSTCSPSSLKRRVRDSHHRIANPGVQGSRLAIKTAMKLALNLIVRRYSSGSQIRSLTSTCRRGSSLPTTLPDVCRRLGITLRHHDALSDAEACAKVVIASQVRWVFGTEDLFRGASRALSVSVKVRLGNARASGRRKSINSKLRVCIW